MWPILASLAIMGVEYAWHNWIDPPKPPPPEQTISVPLTTRATTIPLFYGRCRVTAPVLAYTSIPIVKQHGANNIYTVDMLFVIGVPFTNGRARILQAFVGDTRMRNFSGFLANQSGNGNFENANVHLGLETATVAIGDDEATQGSIEVLNGNSSQTLINPTTGAPTTQAGRYMTSTALFVTSDDQPWNYGVGHTDKFQIPGYRGFLSAFLWAQNQTAHWAIGLSPQVSSYSYEVSSYPASSLADSGSDDVNPIDVLLDLLVNKLGVSTSAIDMQNFINSAVTLRTEGNLMSIAFQQMQTFEEMLIVILKQIDGGFFWNERVQMYQVKLIRADYDTATLLTITPDNCEGLQNFTSGGRIDLNNRVVVTFPERANSYKDGTGVAYNEAVGDDGEVRTYEVSMPGVSYQELADAIAARILAAISRPLMQCRAIVNRSFLRVMPGDVVKLTWPEAGISNIVMRVTGVGYGTLESGAMALDLMQDYFYTHRNLPPIGGWIGIGDITFELSH